MRNVWFGLAASLTLAACEGQLPQFGKKLGSAGGKESSKAIGQNEITVTRSKTRIRGIDGFCVDPVSTQTSRGQAFVVFGNCAAITGNPNQPQPYVQAIATATVTNNGITGEGAVAPQVANLNAFFRTAAGKAALSRSGAPDAVTVMDSFTEDGAVFLRVNDTSPSVFDGAQQRYWRSYFDAGSSVVALSVLSFSNAPVSSAEGLDVLRGFVDRNRRAAAAITSVLTKNPADGGFLDRLFP